MRELWCAVLAAAIIGPAAYGGVLVRDTFDAAGATRGDDAGDATDLAFHTFAGDDTLKVFRPEGGGNAYLSATAPANSRFGSATFPAVTLGAIGDRLTLKYRLQGLPSSAGLPDLRVGIYDSGGTGAVDDSNASRDAAMDDRGYLLALLDDPGLFYSGVFQRDETAPTLTGESGGFIGSKRFADGQWHDVEVTLERNNVGVWVRLAYDGVTIVDNPFAGGTGLYTFDNIQFGVGNVPMEVRLDDVSVEFTAVPEPGTVGAAAGALLMAGARRRRRRA